jgi:hypothetical protein
MPIWLAGMCPRRRTRARAIVHHVVCGAVLACSLAVVSSASGAGVAPTFTAAAPPAEFLYDGVYGPANNCGAECSYNEQVGYAFRASGNPSPTYSVSSGALPSGVYLDPANGLLYGIPNSAGQTYSFSVTASNGVSPSAVAGPFSGTVGVEAGACLPGAPPEGASGGSSTTTTTATETVTGSPVDVMFPNVTAIATRVVGRVIENGTPTVVYEQQLPVPSGDPQAQALLSAAASADLSSAPGASLAAPTLAGEVVSVSAPTPVGQIVPGPTSTQAPIDEGATVTIGPATLHFGTLQSCLFDVEPGSQDINALVAFTVAAATDELQSTETTTSTYYVDATAPSAGPPTPAPPATPSASLSPTAASALALGCSGAKIALTNVHEQGTHVLLEGAAAASLVNSKVKLLLGSARHVVADATVGANGFFTATAPLPPAKIRDTNAASYSAAIGSLRSASLKLTRRLVISSTQVNGHTVQFTGTVLPPLSEAAAPVLVRLASSCKAPSKLVASVKPSKNGAFTVSASIPNAGDAVIFTLESQVRPNKHSHKVFPTYSLPQAEQAG